MTTSQEIKNISMAIVAAQPEIEAALKTSINPHFRSKYADLTSVWDACRSVLKKHKLAVIQTFEPNDISVLCVTTLLHESGEYIQGKLQMPHKDNTPQAIGSAITYARRYSLAAILGIVTDEDDDANEATRKKQESPKAEKPKTEAKQVQGVNPNDLIKMLANTPFDQNDLANCLSKMTNKEVDSNINLWNAEQLNYCIKNFDAIIERIAVNISGETK